MSMNWRYDMISNKKSLIDTIYCSHVELGIPLEYDFNVLLIDGSEYNLTNPNLKKILKSKDDLDILNKARENYIKLNNTKY